MGVPDAYDGCQSIQSDATAESSEDSRRSSFQTSSQASDCGAFAVDIATSDWEGLPAPLLQLIGAQLSVSDLAAGRHTCAAWRTGLSLGVESLAPLVHDGKSFLDPARWAVLEKVPALFPRCSRLDLRRNRVKAATIPALARLTVPTAAVRVDINISKKKQRQVTKVSQLGCALAALGGGARRCSKGGEGGVDLEVHVTDKPFWWNNSLTDRDMSRMVTAMPPNVQVTVLDLSTHVIQNMTRRGFEALAQLTGLRDLTLVNSSTVSSAGIQALSTLTNLEHLHLGAGMPVTDAGIVTMLRGMTRLVSLTLVELPFVTDDGVAAFCRPPPPGLTQLGLHGFTGLREEGLAAVAAVSSLVALDLRSCPEVTGAGLQKLAALPALRRLDLRSCYQVSGNDVRAFRAAAVLPVAVSRGEEVVYDTPYTTDDGCLLFSRALKRLDPAPVRPT